MKILQFPLSKYIICFILGILTQHYLFIDNEVITSILITSFILLLAFHFYSSKTKTNSFYIGILICFSALSFGSFTTNLHNQSIKKNHYLHYKEVFETPSILKITIKEKLKPNQFSNQYIAIINTIDNQNYSGKILLKIKKDTKNKPLEVGNIIFTKQNLSPLAQPKNPYQFNYATYLNNKNIFAQLFTTADEIVINTHFKKDIWYYTSKIRSKIITQFQKKGIQNEELNVAIALLLGQRQDLDQNLSKQYQYAGATHLLAVSGLHVGFVLLFLNLFLKKFPNTSRYNLIKLIIIIGSLMFYALLTGLSPSILRAVLMFSCIAIADYLRRPTNIYHTLLVSAFFILLFDANSLFDVGFQLSYTAVFFIVWMPPIFKKIGQPKNIILQKIRDLLTVSIAAQVGTLPFTLYYFHQFPGLFFITNIIVIPLVSVIMFVGIIAMLFSAFGILPEIIATILKLLIQFLNAFISWIASFEQFTFQNISFSFLLAVTSFLLIICFLYFLKKNTYRNLIMVISSVVLIQSVLLYQKYQNSHTTEFIVYNSPKETILSIKKGENITFYSDTKLTSSNWSIHDYLLKNNTSFNSKKITNFLFVENQKIMIIDSSKIYLKNTNPNVLLLRQTPKINLARVLQDIHPKVIVADGSNYKSIVAQWKKTCKTKKIPFHTTYEMGYYKTY